MQFQNKKYDSIAYLTALTLLFSYAEMILPRIVPFFRLGLGNIAILAAFELSFPPFMLLTILKAVASCLMAGTLFSPFFLISLAQSIFSGFLMYGLFHLNRFSKNRMLTVYGISVAGSVLSALVQIWLSSLYLGSGTMKLLGPMLIFNTISGIITAGLYTILDIKIEDCLSFSTSSTDTIRNSFLTLFLAIGILLAAAGIFFICSLPILTAAMITALILQKISGRKILFMPYTSLWLFVMISSIFIPEGKVIYSFENFSITEGALFSGLEKALKLSTVSALSQCAANLRPSENTLLGKSLAIYRKMLDTMQTSEGKFLQKIKKAIQVQ